MRPTPRKRYTVALSTYITRRNRDEDPSAHPCTPHWHDLSAVFFSRSLVTTSFAHDESSASADEPDAFGEETISKSSGHHVGGPLALSSRSHSVLTSNVSSPASSPAQGGGAKPGGRHAHTKSTTAPLSSQAVSATSLVTRFDIRLRSWSTDGFGLGLGLSDADKGALIPLTTPMSDKSVGPLIVWRQAKFEARVGPGPPQPKALVGKVSVVELVALFDQEKV